MFLIKYYEVNDIIPIPEIKNGKEIKYKDIEMIEHDFYFNDVFAFKDVIVIGVNYISYYVKEELQEKFSYITPVELLDNSFYPVPPEIRKLVRDKIKLI